MARSIIHKESLRQASSQLTVSERWWNSLTALQCPSSASDPHESKSSLREALSSEVDVPQAIVYYQRHSLLKNCEKIHYAEVISRYSCYIHERYRYNEISLAPAVARRATGECALERALILRRLRLSLRERFFLYFSLMLRTRVLVSAAHAKGHTTGLTTNKKTQILSD